MFDFLKPLLSKADRARVSAAIAEAESQTSGEIHVHLVKAQAHTDLRDLARRTFTALGLYRTKRRNGVLILVAASARKAAIWGDEGIDNKGGQALWDLALKNMLAKFSEGRHGEGIEAAVREVGRELAAHFPRRPGDEPDVNELPDEVS